MQETSHIFTYPNMLRRPILQAGALLGLLFPASIALAFFLAEGSRAASPGYAATLTAVIFAFGAIFVLRGLGMTRYYAHDRLGLCNIITLTRAAGIAVLAGLLLAPVAGLGWGLVAMAGLLLLLDGLDGWAARRARLQSSFGARFDMEADVAFSLTLSALAVAMGQVGAWFLLLGLLRPLFLAAGRVSPALAAPLPDARWRKTMAGLQMAGQVFLIAPVLAPPASAWLGAAILTAMIASFAVDIRWLLRKAARS